MAEPRTLGPVATAGQPPALVAPRRVRRTAAGRGAGRVLTGLRGLDPLRLVLAALLVLVLSRAQQAFPQLIHLPMPLALTGLSVVLVVIRPDLWHPSKWTTTWPGRALAGLAVVAVFSVIFGISMGGAGTYFLQFYSKVLVFTLLWMVVVLRARDVALVLWAYMVSAGILVLLALFRFDLTSVSDGMRMASGLSQYDGNDLGLVLTVGFALAILAYQTSGPPGKVATAMIMVGIGAVVAKTGSRGTLVGMVAVGVAVLFVLKGMSVVKRVGMVVAAVVALSLAAPDGYWDRMRTMLNPEADYNWYEPHGRRQIAKRGIQYMLHRPVFGVGVGNFGRAEGTIARAELEAAGYEGPIQWTAPHNSFVQAGAEMGIPGMVLFSSVVLWGMFGLRRLRGRLPPGWQHGDAEQRFLYAATVHLPVAFLGFAVTSFFLSFLYEYPFYVLSILGTGVVVSIRQKLREEGYAHVPVAAGARRSGGWVGRRGRARRGR